MKILKMYIHSLDSHEVGARKLYKIRVSKMKFYTFYKRYKIKRLSDRLTPVGIKNVILLNNITINKKTLKSRF